MPPLHADRSIKRRPLPLKPQLYLNTVPDKNAEGNRIHHISS